MADAESNDGLDPEQLVFPDRCLSCEGAPRWESVCDHWGERWLAVCECGRVETFFPDRRQRTGPRDPLTLFLQGHLAPRAPATPPWIRLFLNSMRGDEPTQWRHSPDPCDACGARTVFGLFVWARDSTAGLCLLCLNCGYTVSSYSNPRARTSELPLIGSTWSPACPAVRRLRDCIYASQRNGGGGGEGSTT